MRSLIIGYALIALFMLSCGDENSTDNTCGSANPIEELPWLSSEIADLQKQYDSNPDVLQYFSISQGTYKGETVFIFNSCCPFCNLIIPVKNCNGSLLGYLGSSDNDINYSDIKDIKIIWKPANFSCNI